MTGSGPFVVRIWGISYEGMEEVHTLCYMTKDGRAALDADRAHHYESEADAWEHIAASDNGGRDSKLGDWAFPELLDK